MKPSNLDPSKDNTVTLFGSISQAIREAPPGLLDQLEDHHYLSP